jgi:hypothetical protein
MVQICRPRDAHNWIPSNLANIHLLYNNKLSFFYSKFVVQPSWNNFFFYYNTISFASALMSKLMCYMWLTQWMTWNCQIAYVWTTRTFIILFSCWLVGVPPKFKFFYCYEPLWLAHHKKISKLWRFPK